MSLAKKLYEFYAAIPKERWMRGDYWNNDKSKCCALGHILNAPTAPAAPCLTTTADALFIKYLGIPLPNMNDTRIIRGNSPKQNILDALQVIAEMGG